MLFVKTSDVHLTFLLMCSSVLWTKLERQKKGCVLCTGRSAIVPTGPKCHKIRANLGIRVVGTTEIAFDVPTLSLCRLTASPYVDSGHLKPTFSARDLNSRRF